MRDDPPREAHQSVPRLRARGAAHRSRWARRRRDRCCVYPSLSVAQKVLVVIASAVVVVVAGATSVAGLGGGHASDAVHNKNGDIQERSGGDSRIPPAPRTSFYTLVDEARLQAMCVEHSEALLHTLGIACNASSEALINAQSQRRSRVERRRGEDAGDDTAEEEREALSLSSSSLSDGRRRRAPRKAALADMTGTTVGRRDLGFDSPSISNRNQILNDRRNILPGVGGSAGGLLGANKGGLGSPEVKDNSWLWSVRLSSRGKRTVATRRGEDGGGSRVDSRVDDIAAQDGAEGVGDGWRHTTRLQFPLRLGRKLLQQTCCQCPLEPSPPPAPLPPPSPPPPPVITGTLSSARPVFRLSANSPG